jgi:hypothetical protein
VVPLWYHLVESLRNAEEASETGGPPAGVTLLGNCSTDILPSIMRDVVFSDLDILIRDAKADERPGTRRCPSCQACDACGEAGPGAPLAYCIGGT